LYGTSGQLVPPLYRTKTLNRGKKLTVKQYVKGHFCTHNLAKVVVTTVFIALYCSGFKQEN